MSSDLSKQILEALREADPAIFGSITVNISSDTVFISGQVRSNTLQEAEIEALVRRISEAHASTVVVSHLLTRGLTVSTPGSLATTEDPTGELDELEILYFGLMPASSIRATNGFKKTNHETLVKVKRSIEVAGFVAPLVLDSTFGVIDGNLRLAAIRKLYGDSTDRKIPVIVVNDSSRRADFLRLVLNRSSEFQRWIYSDVDRYVDEMPQLQPILEPLGFFANKILPTSFFGNTVLQYRIDEYNDQQGKYSQDIGLAHWAELQRARIEAEAKAKQEERDRRKAPTSGLTSLFDLEFSDDDLIETVDINQAIREHTLEQREIAGVITDNYDEIRKKAKEERGQSWQTSRRTTKQKAADKRLQAEKHVESLVDSSEPGELDDLHE